MTDSRAPGTPLAFDVDADANATASATAVAGPLERVAASVLVARHESNVSGKGAEPGGGPPGAASRATASAALLTVQS